MSFAPSTLAYFCREPVATALNRQSVALSKKRQNDPAYQNFLKQRRVGTFQTFAPLQFLASQSSTVPAQVGECQRSKEKKKNFSGVSNFSIFKTDAIKFGLITFGENFAPIKKSARKCFRNQKMSLDLFYFVEKNLIFHLASMTQLICDQERSFIFAVNFPPGTPVQ